MPDSVISPAAAYTALLEVRQAVMEMAASLDRMAKSPAHLETSGALAAIVERLDKALPGSMQPLVDAIKAMPAPRVVVQPTPVTMASMEDHGDYTWVVDHKTNREGTIIQSVVTRTMSPVAGMTKQ